MPYWGLMLAFAIDKTFTYGHNQVSFGKWIK